MKCPGDDVLAGYLDGALDDSARTRIESHLADCAPCRSLIGDVAMMQRSDSIPLPPGLKQRAIALTAPSRKRTRWIVVRAAAAGIACVLIGTILFHKPKNEIGPGSASPIPPIVAKSETPSLPGQATPNIVRRGTTLESLPTLISPQQGSVTGLDKLAFSWKPVAGARYYEINVVTSEGDPSWQAQSKNTDAHLSPSAALRAGTYFVWITAYLADGRIQKSAPVSFVVNASQ